MDASLVSATGGARASVSADDDRDKRSMDALLCSEMVFLNKKNKTKKKSIKGYYSCTYRRRGLFGGSLVG